MKASLRFVVPATLAAALLACAVPPPASAVTKCKVKADKKTGVILVDATDVVGTLQWAGESGGSLAPFFNAGECLSSGKAKKCQIADPATLASKTAPAGCMLYVDDGNGECGAWIPGCSPGVRSIDSIDPAVIRDYVNTNCVLYFGWRDSCNSCTLSPEKWGATNNSSCMSGLGVNNTCTVATLGGDDIRLFGLNTDGDVDDTDKFYIGMRCF